MSKFGLVVLGAHIGIHIKGDIEKLSPEKVLLVEPVPHNVIAIKKNLIHLENVIIEQVALSNINESKYFYFVKEDSIHKLKRFKIEEEDIEKISINTIRFKDLVEKYKIKQIKKLLIDVEGSEYEILSDIDFNSLDFKKILFEYKHFDGYKKTGKKLEEILEKLN